MPRIPLIGGSYSSRSVIASAQRCINYYPEINPKFATVPVTHYQRPGLVPIYTPSVAAPCRGLYRASNGQGGFTVIGSGLYRINTDSTLTFLGNLTAGRTNIVSMQDNGIQVMIVDGSPNGWVCNLDGSGFAQITDPTGTFTGANKVDYIDTFMLWNIPGTRNFGSTLSNQIMPFDSLYTAGKTDYPDLLQSLIVNRHEILLMGDLKSEVWFDAGNALFPFAEIPGINIEHGIAAIYSLASQDISTYWLSRNLQGEGMVMRFRGYFTEQISNPALVDALRKIDKSVGISDAIGYTYQQDNHVFYVLHFPAGDQTWVYDEAVGDPMNAWHQEAWTDSNGVLHRSRANCHAFVNGMNLVGDWENGTIYYMDLDTYTDTVNNLATPLTCIRTFPNLGAAVSPNGQLQEIEGHRMQIDSFVADFEPGGTGTGGVGLPMNRITLRVSLDRGKTWGYGLLQDSGEIGDYLAQPIWRNLGIARYPVFELSHSIPGPATLNGAWFYAQLLPV